MTSRTLGVCYYPEQWSEDRWAQDAAAMVATGLTWVRIGEFSWARIEPEPERFDWGWLDRAVEVLGAAGLKVMMGTPTATPPRWMLTRHPDMLAVDAEGRVRRFGSRRHYCFSHAGYRDECVRIARLFGERYGAHPHVHAWQIDNEYGCHDTVVSYSDAARRAFQSWCEARYGTPRALNEAWGNVFWSMDYAAFTEIGLPNLTVTEANPAHTMAFRRFSSDQVVAFNRAQVEALRPLTERPLSHNYMGRETAFDHHAVSADLDFVTWDSYPIGFLSDRTPATEAHKARFLRQGDPDMQAFHHDLYRGAARDGRWWIMEQQPGPVNWAPHNPAPLPGMARLWAWEAFAHGAECVSYFRWRQAPFGQEQYHAGLQRPDGAPAPAMAEARRVADELAAAPDAGCAPGKAALVFDYAATWAWETQPQGADFDQFALCLDAYRALRSLGIDTDILPPHADLSGYPLVLAPGLASPPPGFAAGLKGVALLGPRYGARTPEMATPVPLPPQIPGLDVTVSLVESLPPGAEEPLAGGGHIGTWVEALEGKAEVIERTQTGRSVMVRAGGLRYLGAWPDAQAFRRIVRAAAHDAGLTTEDLPDGLRRRDTATHRIWFNYAPEPHRVGKVTVPPAGVHLAPL